MPTESTSSQLVRVGHSPDPDDAFMFYALAKGKIPMQGFQVEHVIEDIETLNQRALKGELEVTAVSCHAFAYLADKYMVMSAGSSVGDKYGPILVCQKDKVPPLNNGRPDIRRKRIGIPGKLTTAYLVLQLYQQGFEPVFIPFDQIFQAVQDGKVDLGLIIHEGQITYGDMGLQKILDLGVWWHEQYQLPLPLGVDIIRRDLGPETIRSFAKLFKESIEYALAHRKDALEFALEYGRGLSTPLGDQFVGMYVNDLTVDMGENGMAGFRKLLELGFEKGIIPRKIGLEFVQV